MLTRVPERATVVDVSARDGLQAEPAVLSPAQRARWVRSLLAAGVPQAEAGSFVDPRRVPQMAGTDQVLRLLAPFADRLWVLVPNLRGLEAARDAGARNLVCLVSATETHSRANLGRPIRTVLEDLRPQVATAAEAGLRLRVAISMAWIDPVEGPVPADRVVGICEALRAMGVTELTLCDTYGGASPRAVADVLERVFGLFPRQAVGLHLHDTFGVASANTLVGLMLGVARFDGAVGGLGGCPFAPGARGNMNTAHLVHLLGSLGVATGIDPDRLDRVWEGCRAALADTVDGSQPAAPDFGPS
ncbi:MAG: hydroxymethylglutaryl-CoA lyase [Deferrisomatales bacterium]